MFGISNPDVCALCLSNAVVGIGVLLCWTSVLGAIFLDLVEKASSRKTSSAPAGFPVLVAKVRGEEDVVEVEERKAA